MTRQRFEVTPDWNFRNRTNRISGQSCVVERQSSSGEATRDGEPSVTVRRAIEPDKPASTGWAQSMLAVCMFRPLRENTKGRMDQLVLAI